MAKARNAGHASAAASCASGPMARISSNTRAQGRQHLGPHHHRRQPRDVDAADERHAAHQTVLPEYALARGKIGNTTSFTTSSSRRRRASRRIAYDQLRLRADRLRGRLHRGGGLRDLRRRHVARGIQRRLLHHRADDQHHRTTSASRPQGSSYTAHKLPGREETEFVRSKDMWWRPDRGRASAPTARCTSATSTTRP